MDSRQRDEQEARNAATALHPVVCAALFHQRFTAIHPFRDGNGRTARALVMLLLWRAGFPTEILAFQRILDERRDAYIASLRAADRGSIQEWVQFFAEAVVEALKAQTHTRQSRVDDP